MPALAHIVSAAWRQRLMPALIALQVVFASMILVNALYLFWQQLAPMAVPDGIAPKQVLVVDQLVARDGRWNAAQVQAGAQRLRALPGVRAVAPGIGVPMRESISFELELGAEGGPLANASAYAGEGLIDALGLELIQGRDFKPDEHFDFDLSGDRPALAPVILTRALAKHLFPEGDALGAQLGDGDHQLVVVGVVRHLLRYQVGELDDGRAEFALLLPARVTGTPVLSYVVRTELHRLDAVEEAIPDALRQEFGAAIAPGVPPAVASYERLRALAFQPRRAALWLLGTVCAVVALVTGLGLASLTAYWVEQRTRQIGIRRALGATHQQILRHFQLENLLLVGLGAAIGVPLALAANQWLMQHYELPRLPLPWLPAGAIVLLLLGQLAVWAPARRAASIPPAMATRSA
ncbi:FtsX-like permease family protein [Pseudoxanthomonas daejeonensis]|uniref:ABC transporter permease n=1 Tax=Pseudoxanthomonas daejeonensis TaxID=266062 RepID=UPI001F540F01|nr:FtsX-like permease family protein [Pseudoxanthomonas daejeonensis]UNK57757.1 FtsX-like permease family protein [Pseudoxanthomonas daejeonensis]